MATATSQMSVQRTDLNPCTIQFTVSCTPEQIESGVDRAYKQFAKNMRIPGFRPGHAPKHVVAPLVPANDLAGQAAENIINSALKNILTEAKVQPHDSPAVNLTKLDLEKKECEFTAKIPLAPIVELGEYKGIEVVKESIEVTEKDVDEYLKTLQSRSGKREQVTGRGAAESDVAMIHVRADKGSDDGVSLLIVVGKSFAALDKAVTGMEAEEMKSVSLDFPADFANKDLAGKKGKWTLTVKSLNAVVVPELSDEFAQGLGGDLKSEGLKDLRERLSQRLQAAKAQMAQELVHEQIQEALVSRSKIEVPDTMWESVAGQRMNELAQQAREQGKSLEDYAKDAGMSVDELRDKWQAEAKVQVMRAVAAREVFAAEKLRLTNQDMNEMLVAMAYEYQVHPQDLIKAMQKAGNFRELEIRAVFKKTLDFLTAHSVEGSGEATKKPKVAKKEGAEEKAAKPAAKKATEKAPAAEKKPAPKKK